METLPFTSEPAQAFTVALGSTKYDVTARYNDLARLWTFDLVRNSDQAMLISQVPILIGQDMLAPYALQMGGLIATDLSGGFLDAGSEDFGDRVTVIWLSPDELATLKNLGAAL